MKRDHLYRILGWLLPILCMAASIYFILGQSAAFQAASKARDEANRKVTEAAHEQKESHTLQPRIKYATVEQSDDEESNFVTFLRNQTAADGVTLSNWSSISGDYGKDRGMLKDDRVAGSLRGIRRITGTAILSGGYPQIRAFIGDLEKSNRLYTISNINWTTLPTTTILRLAIARYIMLPSPDKPNPPAK